MVGVTIDVAGWRSAGWFCHVISLMTLSQCCHVISDRRVRPSYRMISLRAPPLNRPRDRRRPSLPPVVGLGPGDAGDADDKTSIGSGRVGSGRVADPGRGAFLRAIPTDACSLKCTWHVTF